VSRTGEKRGAYKILVEKGEWNTPLATDTLRQEDNIKTYLQEIEREAVGGIDLAQYREKWSSFVNMAMNARVL
jgi:thiamine monophosphate synthase